MTSAPTWSSTDRKLDRAEAESLMRQLAADPRVEYVEVDRLMQAAADPERPAATASSGTTTRPRRHQRQPAWDIATGTGVVVAVLDTGITATRDLDANIVPATTSSPTPPCRDGNGRDTDPTDPGDWVTANECGSARTPRRTPAGTARTSPARSPR